MFQPRLAAEPPCKNQTILLFGKLFESCLPSFYNYLDQLHISESGIWFSPHRGGASGKFLQDQRNHRPGSGEKPLSRSQHWAGRTSSKARGGGAERASSPACKSCCWSWRRRLLGRRQPGGRPEVAAQGAGSQCVISGGCEPARGSPSGLSVAAARPPGRQEGPRRRKASRTGSVWPPAVVGFGLPAWRPSASLSGASCSSSGPRAAADNALKRRPWPRGGAGATLALLGRPALREALKNGQVDPEIVGSRSQAKLQLSFN